MTRTIEAGTAHIFLTIATLLSWPLSLATGDGPVAPWYINNVLSTSTDVPGVAKRIQLDETTQVRGTIFRPDGTPAAGAEVWAASLFAAPPRRERVWTDQAGRFTLNLTPLTGKSERWSLSAYQGNASVKIDASLDWINQPSAKQPGLIVARLLPRSRLTCRILTAEDRQPIGDARLFLGDGRVLTSDDDGFIEIGGLKSGNHRSVVIAAGRYRKRVIFDTTMRPDGQLNILLPQAGRIVGEVVDGNGQPVPNAWVKVYGSGTAMALDGRCSVADAKGRFVWDGLLCDQILRSIAAGAEGYEPIEKSSLSTSLHDPTRVTFRLVKRLDRDTNPTPTNTEASSTDNVDDGIATLAKRNVVGVVVDPEGDPVAGASVVWGATEYEEVDREARTADDGSFQLPLVPNRDGYVTVIAEKLAPMFHRVEKDRNVAMIRLQEGATIGGQVVNSAGDTVAGVRVYPMIESPDPSLCNPFWISQRATTTDDLGRFSIDGLPSLGTRFDFLSADHSELRGKVLEIGHEDHVVRLTSRGGFRGRAVDANGNPVTDFLVKIDFPRQRRPDDNEIAGFSAVYRGIGVSYTDPQGQFAWGDDIQPGAVYRVTVQADGFRETAIDYVRGVLLDQLTFADEHVFRLSSARRLSAKVVEAGGGRPIQGATVTVIRRDLPASASIRWGLDDTASTMRMTDEGGIAQLGKMSRSRAMLAAVAPGFAHTTLAWDGTSNDLVLELDREVPIDGKIRSIGGAALVDLSVSLQEPGGGSQWVQLDEDSGGRFEFRSVPAGLNEIVVRDERRELFRKSFETTIGQSAHVEVTVDVDSGKTVELSIHTSRQD